MAIGLARGALLALLPAVLLAAAASGFGTAAYAQSCAQAGREAPRADVARGQRPETRRPARIVPIRSGVSDAELRRIKRLPGGPARGGGTAYEPRELGGLDTPSVLDQRCNTNGATP